VPLALAAGVSAGVAWVAWRAGTLTRSGAAAAWTVGLLVLYGAGWNGGAVLAAFFISSNLVSRVRPGTPPASGDAKGDRRDLWQVYANGGIAAAGAVVARGDFPLAIWLVTGCLAAATADTWATSIGTRSRQPPRLLGLGRIVSPGTSGGMTWAGSLAALAGASIVSGIGAVASGNPLLFPAGTLIGFAGMVVDSILGAMLQGRFHCPVCDEPSEWRVHRCGSPTARRGGLAWLNNDAVNFLTTALAAGAALMSWRLLD
jgi:uncharacterized protein (TIGR00297 family)